MKKRNWQTLQIGDIGSVHSRFCIPEHRGKTCKVSQIFSRRNAYNTHYEIEFLDGTTCSLTAEDLSPSRFSPPSQ